MVAILEWADMDGSTDSGPDDKTVIDLYSQFSTQWEMDGMHARANARKWLCDSKELLKEGIVE